MRIQKVEGAPFSSITDGQHVTGSQGKRWGACDWFGVGEGVRRGGQKVPGGRGALQRAEMGLKCSSVASPRSSKRMASAVVTVGRGAGSKGGGGGRDGGIGKKGFNGDGSRCAG